MKINCNMADDLLPLYLDDICSDDSKTALNEHLQECPACREKLAKMQSNDILPNTYENTNDIQLTKYAKKVKRHRIRVAILSVLGIVLSSIFLALIILTICDMHIQTNPTIFPVEEGTYNLTAKELKAEASEIYDYILYTNSTKIAVTVQTDSDFEGTIKLYNASNTDDFIMIGDVSEDENTRTFTGLSSSTRYIVSCENLDDKTVIVSEGRTVNFLNSFVNVLQEISLILFN